MEIKNVLLDFSVTDYSDAEACEERNLVHRSKLDEFMSVLREQMTLAEEEMNRWIKGIRDVRFIHNAISVYASRGAGKTTFLLSAMKKVKEIYKDKAIVLDTIDPSLIDTKQKPIVNIIAAIHEQVRDSMTLDVYCTKEEKEQRQKVEEHYKTMLRALPFMDGIGKDPIYADWDDEEYIAGQGIEKAIACNNLEKEFQNYVFEALRILKKECIVIPFDDIDTDFKKGYEILEIIRKYLTTPFIITVLTGDLELYGKLVRKESWKCFDSQLMSKELKYASRKPEEFSAIINQLENQYLVKILKPEYRISISTMREYMEDRNYELQIMVKFDKDGESFSINECYEKFLCAIGVNPKNVQKIRELSDFLLNLSMRIQIRLLRQIKKLYTISQSRQVLLADGVMSVFWNDLNQKTSNAKILLRSSENYTIEMLKFLIYTHSLDDNCDFMPETSDEILNKAMFAVGTKFNSLLAQYPNLIIDYWVRIPYVSCIVNQLKINQNDYEGQRNLNEDSKLGLVDYSGFKSETGITESICKSQAYYNAIMRGPYQDGVEPMAGVLTLNNVTPLMQRDQYYQLALLPLFGVFDSDNNETVYLSIYKYLAIIAEMIVETKELKEYGQDNEEIADRLINNIGQYKTYIEPSFSSIVYAEETNKEGMHFIYENLDNDGFVVNVIGKFIEWADSPISMTSNISCDLLNRVFTRFYHTLIHVNAAKDLQTGDCMSRYVVSLLNSVLVEEAIDRHYNRIITNNISDIEYIYSLNLQRISSHSTRQQRDMFWLHTWLSNCPLLTVFISPYMQFVIDNPSDSNIQYMRAWRNYRVQKDNESEQNTRAKELTDSNQRLNALKKEIDNLRQLIFAKSTLEIYEQLVSMQKDKIGKVELDKLLDQIKDLRVEIDRLNDKYRKPIVERSLNINLNIESTKEDVNKAMNMVTAEIGKNEMLQEELTEQITETKTAIKKLEGFAIDEYKKLKDKDSVYNVLNTLFSKKKINRVITPF